MGPDPAGAGPLTYEELIRLLGQVGFPIVVAGYLLLRMERTLQALVRQIERLVTLVESHRGGKAP